MDLHFISTLSVGLNIGSTSYSSCIMHIFQGPDLYAYSSSPFEALKKWINWGIHRPKP